MDISRITDYLYIASKVKSENVKTVHELAPHLIISMIYGSRPPQELEDSETSVLWLRTFDFPLFPIPVEKLNEGVESALPVIRNGNRVLVFCQGGRHRSVAMASCILIGMGYSADEAMNLVISKREVADPHAWHIKRQIKKFASYWNEHHSEDAVID